MAVNLLSDAQMRRFIVNGFVTVTTELPAQFHDTVYEKTVSVFDKEGNPGNNLLPRIPEIQQVFDDRNVRGALTSLLGEDYYMQPHRHPHYNPPGSGGQGMHQDGGKTVGRIIRAGYWFSTTRKTHLLNSARRVWWYR